ncbi:MAG: DUF2127 domain-containing protein [Patescibacteria group bacterium]|nr:DUF2127 domain-containing protein [Patescibacteria group bacterium]
MDKLLNEKTIRRLFDISVISKGLHALSEVVSGIIVLFVSKTTIVGLSTTLTAEELAEDPHDFFANYVMHSASQLSVSFQHLAALYLISHGLIIGFLVVGLLMKKLWSYPVTMVVLATFIAYQTYQFTLGHSLWVLGVTILDAIVILLTWHEYRYIKKSEM